MTAKRDVRLTKEHRHGGTVYAPGATLRGLDEDTAERLVNRGKGEYADSPASTGGVKRVVVKDRDTGLASEEPKPE